MAQTPTQLEAPLRPLSLSPAPTEALPPRRRLSLAGQAAVEAIVRDAADQPATYLADFVVPSEGE